MKKTIIIDTETFTILGKELLELDYQRIYKLAIKDKKIVEEKIKNILREKNLELTPDNISHACTHLELDLVKIWYDEFSKKLHEICPESKTNSLKPPSVETPQV